VTGNRPWLRLICYCMAAVLAISLAIATLFAGASLAFGLGQDQADPQDSASQKTVSGVITDSRCGAKHTSDSGKSSAECTRGCVRHGAEYVVVNGDTAYVLQGNRTVLDSFAGQRVQVNGTVNGETLKVISVRAQ
jgi:hypothetical protein